MKKDSIEADSTFSTQFRRKTSCKSEYVHHKKYTEIEDINSTA